MPHPTDRSIRDALRAAIIDAARRRDRAALPVYRTALAAIDNAEAVPLPADLPTVGTIDGSRIGVGVAEAERLHLTEDEMRAIVGAEAQERRAAAVALSSHPGQADAAHRLETGAALLTALLDPQLDALLDAEPGKGASR